MHDSLYSAHDERLVFHVVAELVAAFCEAFPTHVDLPKEKWFKSHPPIEVKVVAPITVD